MIINFSVRNFGSIKEKQSLSFLANKSDHLEDYYIIEPIKGLRLNKLALIYGANASGKTTVLKALDFLKDIITEPLEKKTEKLNYEPFLFDQEMLFQNCFFELEFIKNGLRYFYELELNKNCIVFERLSNYNPNKAIVFERVTDELKEIAHIKIGSKIKNKAFLKRNLEIHTLWNNTVLGGYLKSNIDNIEIDTAIDFFISQSPLAEPNHSFRNFVYDLIKDSSLDIKFLIQLLKKADFNFSNLYFKEQKIPYPNGFENILNENLTDEGKKLVESLKSKGEFHRINIEINFEHKVNGYNYILPLESESLGTQKYFDLAGLLYVILRNDRILLIDEIESSLHPDLLKYFLLTYIANSKQASQLIITTHNREILADKDLFRNDAIWFTDKNEDSATELYSLADFDSSVVRDTTNVLNTYKSGKLGGVPNLGDYYIDLDDAE